jgi:hypothetical protein
MSLETTLGLQMPAMPSARGLMHDYSVSRPMTVPLMISTLVESYVP